MELTKCKLGELITQRREKNDGSDLPICGVSKDGLIPPKQKDADTSIYNVFYRDDFIFNPARMELNSIAINDMYDRAICSSLYEVFYVHRTDLLLPHYLKLIIRQKWFTRYCEFLGQGSAREYCRFGNISEIEIEFPPIKEQQKIVDYNTAIENRIALKQKINDNLANQISAIYDDYFVQYKCSTVTSYIDSPLGKIPSNYKVLTIGELGCDISDGNYSSKYPKADEFQTVGIPFIRGVDFIGTNISKRNLLYITPEKHNELLKGHTKENDILITTRGVGIGKIAFVPSDMIDVNINSQLIRINGGNTYPRVFLSQSLISNRGKNEIQANVTGSAQPQLPVGNFKNIKIVIPPESQILDFCRICNPLLNAQLENYQEIDVLQKLLDVLLTKLSSR